MCVTTYPIGKNTWSARGKRWQLVAYVPVKNYVAGTWQARGSLTMMNRYVAIRGNTWQCQRVTKQQYHAFMCNVDVFLFSESRQIQYALYLQCAILNYTNLHNTSAIFFITEKFHKFSISADNCNYIAYLSPQVNRNRM